MQVAVLSPHRDDAAFSCALSLHALLLAGSSLTIVNVCTISRYAPYLSISGTELTEEVSEVRRDEDDNFAEELCQVAGVDRSHIKFIDMKWQDVPIRWRTEEEQALAPLSLRAEEVDALQSLLHAMQPFDLVFVPMALGGHLDHRLVLQAALQAYCSSCLVFYEDLPYASSMSGVARPSSAPEATQASCEAWLPAKGSIAGLKRDCALCYPSQIAPEIADEMESYALEHGGRERFLATPEAMHRLQRALQGGTA